MLPQLKSTIAELAKLTEIPVLQISAAAIPIEFLFATSFISAKFPHSPIAEVEKLIK